jgi:hypothetical protein
MSLKIYQGLNLDYPTNNQDIVSSIETDVIDNKIYVKDYVFYEKSFSRLLTNSKYIVFAINELFSRPTDPITSSPDILRTGDKLSINDTVFLLNVYNELLKPPHTIIGCINANSIEISNLLLTKQEKLVDSPDNTIVGNQIFTIKYNYIPTVDYSFQLTVLVLPTPDNPDTVMEFALTLKFSSWDNKSNYVFKLFSHDSGVGFQDLKLNNFYNAHDVYKFDRLTGTMETIFNTNGE